VPLSWGVLANAPFIVSIDLAKSFGKGTGFAIGLILLTPIFYLILAFGDATYRGPAATPAGTPAPRSMPPAPRLSDRFRHEGAVRGAAPSAYGSG